MVDIQLIAFFLLVGRAFSVVFMLMVLRKQIQLTRLPIDERFNTSEIGFFRKTFLILSIVILLGNIIPILIDTITLFADNTGRPSSLRAISIAYAFSNSLTAALSAFTIWFMYRFATKKD